MSDVSGRLDLGLIDVAEAKGEMNYAPPANCQGPVCKEYRPACLLGICKLKIVAAGDW